MGFFSLYSYSFLKKEPVKIFLALIGIVLGVAVYGAMRLANERVISEFAKTADLLSGKSEYEIKSSVGKLDEEVLRSLWNIDGIQSLSPKSEGVIEIYSDDAYRGEYRVLGVDISANRDLEYWEGGSEIDVLDLLRYQAVLVSEELSKSLEDKPLSLKAGDRSIQISKVFSLSQQGITRAYGGDIIVMDISLYQKLFETYGAVDSFDLKLKSEDHEKTVATIQDKLPKGVVLQSANDREVKFERMTAAFRLNLSFLAGISLLVALLLIYNTASYLTLKRRKDFGVLLSIGMTPAPLFLFLLTEAFILGIFGTLLGIVGAYALAHYTTDAVALTISTLYIESAVYTQSFPVSLFIELLLLGPVVAVLGVTLPALEVFTYRIKETFHYENVEARFQGWVTWISLIGGAFIVLSLLFARTDLLKIHLLMGFISPAFLSVGMILLAPLMLVISASILSYGAEKLFGVEAQLALDHIWMRLRRNSAVVASIALSLGMFIGVTVMISSFRSTVSAWLEDVIQADIFISLPSKYSNRNSETLPAEFVSHVKNHHAVSLVNSTASVEIPFKGAQTLLTSEDFEALIETGAISLSDPYRRKGRRSELFHRRAILISEAFSTKYGYTKGDTVSISLPGGELQGVVSEVFVDYVSEHGVVLIDREWFSELTGMRGAQGLGVYLGDKADPEKIVRELRELDKDNQYLIRDNQGLRKEVFRIFDKTFQITYALQAISLLISTLVLLNTLLMLQLERKREFMSFRAIGASFMSLMKMVVYEGLIIGAVAACWGIVLGIGLSLLLVYVINRHFFGWSVSFLLSGGILFQTLISVILLSTFIGVVVSFLSLKKIDVEVLRYE